jgi:hypothetical protein
MGAQQHTEMMRRDVGVNLGGREILMPQQPLQGHQISAALQQVGGKGVPQHMGRHALLW